MEEWQGEWKDPQKRRLPKITRDRLSDGLANGQTHLKTENSQTIEMRMSKRNEEGRGGHGVIIVTVTLICILWFSIEFSGKHYQNVGSELFGTSLSRMV